MYIDHIIKMDINICKKTKIIENNYVKVFVIIFVLKVVKYNKEAPQVEYRIRDIVPEAQNCPWPTVTSFMCLHNNKIDSRPWHLQGERYKH